MSSKMTLTSDGLIYLKFCVSDDMRRYLEDLVLCRFRMLEITFVLISSVALIFWKLTSSAVKDIYNMGTLM